MNQELKIIVRADGTAQVVSQLNTVNASMAGTTAKSATMASTMSSQFGKIAASLGLAALGFTAFRKGISIINESIEQARQAEIAINKLNNAIDNSAISAQITSLEMRNMATELQRISNYGDEDILNNVTNSLLKFRSIGNDVFGRAQKSVIDLAEAMGGGTGSLAGAARMVGMALEDPIIGLTRLRRAGVVFTQSEQDLIKSLTETGRITEAQTMLLGALETRFSGAATAGINSATQLKNAWGDYLENAGNGFNSFVTSMNVGMTSFLYSQTASAEATSDIINKALAQNRVRQANFMSGLLITGKSVLLTIGMTGISVFGIITDAFDAVYRSISNVKTMTLSVFNGLGNIAPRIMEAITGVSSFKDALGDLRSDFTEGISKDGFGLDGFGNATKRNIENIKTLYNEVKKNIEDVTAFNEKTINATYAKIKIPELDLGAFDNIGAEAQADNLIEQTGIATASTLEQTRNMQKEMLSAWATYYQAVDKYGIESVNNQAELYRADITEQYGAILGKQQLDEMYNENLWKLRNEQLAHFDEERTKELEATRKLTNDKLSAQLAYLQATQPLEQSRIDAQLAIYAQELEAYRALGLSKYETDQMFTAKRTELEKANNEERLAEWQREHELKTAMIESLANSFEREMGRMVQIETSSNSKIVQGFVNTVNSLLAEINRYIAKLILAAMWKAISMGISGGTSGVANDWYYNMDVPTIGVANTPNIGSISNNSVVNNIMPATSSNSRIEEALIELREEMRSNKSISANLYIDGKQLRNELKRVETRVNSLAGAR